MLDTLSEEMWFFMYLLECYAAFKNRNTGEVLRDWDERGITQEVYDGWWRYHQERIENAYCDIECLMETGEHADLHPEYWKRY